MYSRPTAFTLLILAGTVTAARADVSLTDQQTFASRAKYASGSVIASPLAAGQVPRLIDGTGLEWFVNDEVTYSTISSAVGAASDAVFVGAVEATTASGGTELALLADAFDGYNGLQVAVNGAAFVTYNQLPGATSDCNGRQIIEPAMTIGGLSVSRKIYVPATDGFARWLNIVSNPTGAAATVSLKMQSDLGSDLKTKIGTTSSGDALATIADDWITSYEDFTGTSSRTPRLAHVLSSPGSAIRLASVSFVNGDDKPTWSYDFSVPAGGSIVVANFAAGLASRPDAALKAAQLAALPPGSTACMSPTETTAMLNMKPGVVPSGPAPTGPASIEITSPTTDSTFTATTPFLSIGGTAGPSRLTGVTWASNRGFSGTALGGTDWTIPDTAILPGSNVITVTATYSDGAPISDTLTVQRGSLSYELPEGATGSFFSTDLLIANPNPGEVDANVRFLRDNGTVITLPTMTLAGLSRTTLSLGSIPGLESIAASSVVSTPGGEPLIVERTMFWDGTSYGSHGAAAIEGQRKRFLFGEGAQGFFHTYVLLANSSLDPASVQLQFLREAGTVVIKDFVVGPNSRQTVDVGSFPELSAQAFSIVVDSDIPIVAERAMYFGSSPLFTGGTDSAGVGLASTQWNFAEGAASNFFTTFYLLGNAGPRTAHVTMTYQLAAGGTVTVNRTVPPYGRKSINAAFEAPQLNSGAFALSVLSDEPITAERSMYWDTSAPGGWYEAHNSFGVSEPAMKWGLAEGRVGQDRSFQTYILVGNSSADESKIRATFLRVGGGTVIKNYTIPANSRFNINVNSMVPELVNEDFGAIIEVVEGSPVIVERSLYNASGGVTWAAGTNTQAVRLP
jgi:hypothetical protein